MNSFLPLSTEEQLTMHLRREILKGRLSGTMPGVLQLAAKLKTSPRTVTAAVKRLEHDGFLEGQGAGRRSRIVTPDGQLPPGMRIELLLYDEADLGVGYIVELKHQLQEAGHSVSYSEEYMSSINMDVRKLARYVRKRQADAWVVLGGSQPVLEWFAAQPAPTLAMFGRMRDVPIPGVIPDKIPALTIAVRRLAALGHQRIVLLTREVNRLPRPSLPVQKFLDLLEAEGVRTGAYNLPDWQVDGVGLSRCLDSLFQHTPPTAIILDEALHFMAARLHLAQRGIATPLHVSMICLDSDPLYFWCQPHVSHIYWDTHTMARRIVQWAHNVASGKKDLRKTFLKAEFIEGGTIGPVNGKE